MIQQDLLRIAFDYRARGVERGRIAAAQIDVNLGWQGESVGVSIVARAHGPTGCLRSSKLYLGIGPRRPAIAVKGKIARLEVNRVLQFFRRGLVGAGLSGRIGFQIDLNLALRHNVAGLLVVGEIIPVDLIETRRIFAVNDDADLAQFRPAVELELNDIAGLNCKQRPPALGLGELEAAGGLLDVEANLSRNLLQDISLPQARRQVHAADYGREQQSDRGQPSSQPINR